MTGQSIDKAAAVVVGGGLAGGLLAVALAERRAGRVVLVEASDRLGGNHTWSFHETDVPPAGWPLVDDLIAHRWSDHDVKFPGLERRMSGAYASITSSRFAAVVARRLERAGAAVALGTPVARLDAGGVVLADGRAIRARLVFDARGPAGGAPEAGAPCGYQKFVGLEVELAEDAGFARPLLIGATVAQRGAFRFVYVLPFGPRHLLVEDTSYENDPALDRAAHHARVLSYLAERGHRVAGVLREEHGVLPLPWRHAPAERVRSPLVVGYRGGFFHPVTGYSFPLAVRLAVAAAAARDDDALVAAVWRLAEQRAAQARFAHLLNRLMFTAVEPDERWRLLARFYALPNDLIARFYALRLSTADRIRLLAGRPPVGLSWRAALFPKEAP